MKNSTLMLVAGVGLAVSAAGCFASTHYRITNGHSRPSFDGPVLIYQQTPPQEVQYEVIGDFVEQKQWYGGTGETDRESLRAAAEQGANGILIEHSGVRPTAFSWASPYTEGQLLWISNYDAAAAAQRSTPGEQQTGSTQERLKELDELHRQGLISDAEYQTKRAAIIDSL